MRPGIDYIGITTPFYCNDGQGKFLFHRRGSQCRDEQGTWDPGSGQLEFGLTPEQNVLKEVMEEYGCEGTIQGQIPAHTILRTHRGAKTHWLALPYFVLVDPLKARINEPEKMEKLVWCSLDDLPEPLHSGFRMSYTSYPDYFHAYLPALAPTAVSA